MSRFLTIQIIIVYYLCDFIETRRPCIGDNIRIAYIGTVDKVLTINNLGTGHLPFRPNAFWKGYYG